MKRDEKIMTMYKSEYEQDAGDYIECGFKYGFFCGLAAMKEIAKGHGILLDSIFIKKGLKLMDKIWEKSKI